MEAVGGSVKFGRVWAMPSPETFSIPPIADLLKVRLWGAFGDKHEVIDPFARNSTWANWTNDLNPKTHAKYHMKAEEFLRHLLNERGEAWADAALFDPPYSPRQLSECYQSAGITASMEDTQASRILGEAKALMAKLLKAGGVAISFGWNSGGIGKTLGMELEEVLLVCHGGGHNDTIVTVERKLHGIEAHGDQDLWL